MPLASTPGRPRSTFFLPLALLLLLAGLPGCAQDPAMESQGAAETQEATYPTATQPANTAPANTAPANTAPTIVYLVRHAEKDRTVKEDPPLKAEGRARAEHLAHVLADAGIEAIYATPWQRTRQTAAPLAAALGLEARIVDTEGEHIAEMVRILTQEHPGQRVLAVGHSNTVPELARALGAADAPDIPDHRNHDLYLLRLGTGDDPTAGVEFVHLRYGDASQAPASP